MSAIQEMPDEWINHGAFDTERECGRCGDVIAAKWRHFMRPCRCTYLPADQGPHLADPECELCSGTGFLPCEPQDLSVLRMSGQCAECGAWSFKLIADGGYVEGSGRHYDDAADHVVVVEPSPLLRSVNETLDRVDP